MSVEALFGNFFKPEVKSSGRKLFAQEKISLSNRSDTAIQAYARVSPPFKISLLSEDISSPSFTAECNCPVAKKTRFCKHIWGTLLATEEEHPDFLSSKTEINHLSNEPVPETLSEKTETKSSAKNDYQEKAKERANDYRKAQYQKQKQYAKDKKRAAKGIGLTTEPDYSPEVTSALAYFSLNGFPMAEGPSKEIMTEAKRKLSRLFHPDKGGTHEETVELNQMCEVISDFVRSNS